MTRNRRKDDDLFNLNFDQTFGPSDQKNFKQFDKNANASAIGQLFADNLNSEKAKFAPNFNLSYLIKNKDKDKKEDEEKDKKKKSKKELTHLVDDFEKN